MATIDKTVARHEDVAGLRNRRIGKYTGPSSYVTNGDALSANEVRLGVVEFLHFESAIDGAGGVRLLVYDHANAKVLWYVPSSGAEVAGTTDLSTYSARFEAIGK